MDRALPITWGAAVAVAKTSRAAASNAAAGKFDKILVAATTNIAGQDVTAESAPAALEIANPLANSGTMQGRWRDRV